MGDIISHRTLEVKRLISQLFKQLHGTKDTDEKVSIMQRIKNLKKDLEQD
jgi:hypothetical protein